MSGRINCPRNELARDLPRRGPALLLSWLCVQRARHKDAIAKANEKKARATLAAMVQALGGDRWLSLKDETFDGRTSGFYQGKPTGGIGDYFLIVGDSPIRSAGQFRRSQQDVSEFFSRRDARIRR